MINNMTKLEQGQQDAEVRHMESLAERGRPDLDQYGYADYLPSDVEASPPTRAKWSKKELESLKDNNIPF